MQVIQHSGKRNYAKFALYSCHGFLTNSHSEFTASVSYTDLTEADRKYYQFLSRVFKLVPQVKLEHNTKNNILTFSIDRVKTSQECITTYACFCMFRFPLMQHGEFVIGEWYKLYKKYPRKDKFKLLLWINNYYIYNMKNPKYLYHHSFYDYNKPFTIYEMITFRKFLKKDLKNNNLNSHFEKVETCKSLEDKKKELEKMLETL